MFKRSLVLLGALATALCLSSCHPKAQAQAPTNLPTQQANADTEPSLRDKTYHEVPEIKMVHFDFDSARLRTDARDILKNNYDALAAHKKWSVLVEGHCDERGTIEYNLALGQMRASAVRKYYEALGIPGSRIATISYGKEKPLCEEHTEDCWAQNRRGVTKVAEPQVSEPGKSQTL